MNLKFVANYQRGVVDIQLYDEIGYNAERCCGISGRAFASEIQWLDSQPDISTIRVRINSPGGLLIDALSIFNAIRNCTTNVETYIDGVAASSAGLIAMSGKKRYMNDFAKLMVHAPSVTGEAREKMDAATLGMLDTLNDLIAEILAGNSDVKKTKVLKYLDAETWFDAKEALAEGFIDEIINTGRSMPVATNTANLAEVCNSITNILNQSDEMKTVINSLGLAEATSEAQVLQAVENLKKDKVTLEQNLATATNNLNEANRKLADQAKAAATAVVNAAITAGKFGAEKRDELVALGVTNLTLLETMISAMPTPAANVTNHINPADPGANVGKVINGKFDGKTYRELEKTNPGVITNLLSTDKKAHDELYKAQYGTDYVG